MFNSTSIINGTFKKKKRLLILPLDILFIIISSYLACTFRFDSFDITNWSISNNPSEYLKLITLLVFTKALVFIIMGLYRNIWAYASIHDLLLILKAVTISSLACIMVMMFYNRLQGIPRSVLILDGILLFLLLSFRSMSWRIFRDIIFMRLSRNGKRTLLIGADIAANRLVGELRSNHAYQLLPVGFLDDDSSKIGGSIQGLPVFGTMDDLDHFSKALNIDAIIITKKLNSNRLRKIYRSCEENGISCKTLPPLNEILTKPEIGKSLREISLEDLLGRDVVHLEMEGIRKVLCGRTILISGAGGSIGSEVCRQLVNCDPAAMILLDSAETPLYEIDYEIRNAKSDDIKIPQIVSIIGDIRNTKQLQSIFLNHDIHVVFHCAAYKHVPMMELNSGEAIMNNIIGTCNIANASRDAGVDRFVMISTDKAVNPVNIMGATKRIAELYIQNLARTTDTKYITVRFGNVLGSNGSVIPLFSRQIASGGPVTVTHPEIIRYFMTIQEAAGLVIQAGVMGQEGEIFILDMGEPVKIKDLAEDMIRFAGFIPHADIEIRYIGLRPGEKLFEELLLAGEGIQPTRHDKIHIALSRHVNLNTLIEQIDKLQEAAQSRSRSAIDDMFGRILPEYRPVRMLDYRAGDTKTLQEQEQLQERDGNY